MVDTAKLLASKAEDINDGGPLIFNKETRQKVNKAKVLVVGAGGIGCELLKNLVLSGFEDIEIVSLYIFDIACIVPLCLFTLSQTYCVSD